LAKVEPDERRPQHGVGDARPRLLDVVERNRPYRLQHAHPSGGDCSPQKRHGSTMQLDAHLARYAARMSFN
jgi:hypothetical protein